MLDKFFSVFVMLFNYVIWISAFIAIIVALILKSITKYSFQKITIISIIVGFVSPIAIFVIDGIVHDIKTTMFRSDANKRLQVYLNDPNTESERIVKFKNDAYNNIYNTHDMCPSDKNQQIGANSSPEKTRNLYDQYNLPSEKYDQIHAELSAMVQENIISPSRCIASY
jgi:hypothetical protein